MKEEFLKIPLVKNEEKKRFEINVDGYIAFVNYLEKNTQIALVHTEVPEILGGRGVASALVEKTLHYIDATGKLILPFCPYVFAYIQKHPQWKRIVDKRFKGYDKL